jgi:HEAT repeat protein
MKKCLMMMAVCFAAGVSCGDVWQDLAKYTYGQGNAAGDAEQLLQKTPVNQHGAIEDSLIAVVSAKDATQDGKAIACRMLQQIGTEKCITAVASLLKDEVLSDYARLVLERIKSPTADAAMVAALESAPDKAKVGMMGSLGVRRDANAVEVIAKLVAHSDPAVAGAAIAALGKIGGAPAASILGKLKPAECLESVYTDALLDCGRSLTGAPAVALYEQVLAGKSTQRICALSGLLAADEKVAVEKMVGFLTGDDDQMLGGVLTLVCEAPSAALTKAMTAALPTLPDGKKVALLIALGARGDKEALSSICGCLASTNEAVQKATLAALGKLGDASTVKLLLETGGSASDVLAKMSGSNVDDTLIQTLSDSKLREPAIKALVSRSCVSAVPALLKLVTDEDAAVRKAAWTGLGSLATEADVGSMAKAAFAIKDEKEMSDAVGVARRVCAQATDKAACFDTIAAYYDGTTDVGKAAIITLASSAGTPHALDIVKKAMGSANQELAGSALRSLAAWSNAGAADTLLEMAKATNKGKESILALRGYINIAGLENSGLKPEERCAMLKTADPLATRPEEKRLIIGALRTVRHADAFTMISAYMDDPALKEEAEQSAVEMISNFRKDKTLAEEAKKLTDKLPDSKKAAIADKKKPSRKNAK